MDGPVQVPGHEVMRERAPLAYPAAARALAGCFAATARLIWRRRIHLPSQRVGMRLLFADGTSARVFRETIVDRDPAADPCVLVVEFRLRAVHGRGHAAFRRESLLNTPLFAGFPGLVSKLWLADDERGRYRGLYEWDGPRLAENYARTLWRVLALVSVPGSIHYIVLPGLRRDALLDNPRILVGGAASWWRLAEVGLPDTACPHLSLIRQMDVERVLAAALADRGIEVERSRTVDMNQLAARLAVVRPGTSYPVPAGDTTIRSVQNDLLFSERAVVLRSWHRVAQGPGRR